MKVIPIFAHAGITGFESPAEEYTQLALDLLSILVPPFWDTHVEILCKMWVSSTKIYLL